jgi:hypothetical protein
MCTLVHVPVRETSWSASTHNPFLFVLQGYGAIQPVIPNKVGDCLPITITMALEGFFGVLIASLCSAIFFAKVSRIQSFAQVDFSDVVCIRFGHGLNDETPIGNNPTVATTFATHMEDESSSTINVEMDTKFPCPILEFRLVNRMHNIPGGEIVDARINVVASIDSANFNSFAGTPVNGLHRNSARAIKRRPGKKRRVSRRTERTDLPPVYSLSERVASMRTMTLPRLDDSYGGIDETRQSSIPRTVLTKLECDSLDHPFFKRVFTVRHRLDEYSPLLKVGPKLMIQANGGYWPHELNDAESVRESIHFDEIIIRLTGLSNADANTVFSHTVYDFHDLRVGYQFSHMLYRSVGDGSLRANTSLLSSIIEQEGGGGEVLKSEVNVRKIRDVSMRL